MINVSKVFNDRPKVFKTDLEKEVYDTLDKLKIEYYRVVTDEAITMEDCVNIKNALETEIVKTLFLCNQKKTKFYLYVTKSNRRFDTKIFCKKLGISRVSFASEELLMEKMKVNIGATSVFCLLNDNENATSFVIDKDILKMPYYGCSDTTTTGYMKIKMEDLYKFLKYVNHEIYIIDVEDV